MELIADIADHGPDARVVAWTIREVRERTTVPFDHGLECLGDDHGAIATDVVRCA